MRSDIVIGSAAHPLVYHFLKEMLAQGYGFTSFASNSRFTAATIQGWAQGKMPRLDDLEEAYAVLGMELWPVYVVNKQRDLERIRQLLKEQPPKKGSADVIHDYHRNESGRSRKRTEAGR